MKEINDEAAQLAKPWQKQLNEAFHRGEDLCTYLRLSLVELPISVAATKNFPLRVPLSFAACMEKGNPNDPLLRQVLPVSDEMRIYPGYSADPVGDLSASQQIGVIHKYHGRALLINTGACAIHCRYCFRRNFPYAQLQLGKRQEQAALDYLAANTSITEVILSGGDPLLLSDTRLTLLLAQLSALPSIKRIRLHSRLPIVLPARINDALIDGFNQCIKPIVLVVHCNHANEINQRVISACQRLKSSGITLLNQAVLLKGVNDQAEVLGALIEQLFAIGIMPYYLHLLDKATGTGHFEVSEAEALRLIQDVQDSLPGYLVPQLVREVAGAPAKQRITTPVQESILNQNNDN